ncbi:MAG: outer membrane protein [Gammaproteobacteria bacterium]
MNKMTQLKTAICILAISSSAFATTNSFQAHPFYVSIVAGIFQGNFKASYTDQTSIFPQSFAQSEQQYGYTGGLAVGYSRLVCQKYLLGAELSGYYNSHQASFQDGTAISDKTRILTNADLAFVPGLLLNDSTAAYLKLGASYAYIQDNLTSVAGFNPVFTNFNSHRNRVGFVAGLGVRKFVTEHISLLAEANYHDFGTASFSQFQNFTTTYKHSSHIYSYSALIGASYSI